MKCEMCKDTEATIHLTQVVDGVVKKVHLCEACAAKSGFDVHGPMSITDILLGMGGASPESSIQKPLPERSCPVCHVRRADFKKTGRLGCPACYTAFEDELGSLLKVMHRGGRHIGKIPKREGERMRASSELARLQKELDDAIQAERFEEAAAIRDRIKACKAAMQDGADHED